MHLLLVEDDDTIAKPLVTGLEREGWAVSRVETGEEALRMPVPDLVLLDLGLPDLDGVEVCRRLREQSPVPIIVVTARGEELDRVLLLEIGADDYVVKPFGFRELVARIRAVLRRSGRDATAGTPPEVSEFGRLVVDRRGRRVSVDGEDVHLTPKEFDLLSFLAAHPGAVLSREQILNEVWDTEWWGPTKTLDVHVASLRRKLGDAASIETVRGVGFRFAGPA
ncbi:MAG: response regulator transcription factor [Acidimicrobiia bacterium]|nr:response regulator transcription factor [Acidimicrobiia bacterium]